MLSLPFKKVLPILLIFIALLGFIELVKRYNPGSQQTERCDLNKGSCDAQIGERKITFTLSPTPARSRTPLSFSADISGTQPDRAWLDIQGDTMYMGVNQPEMKLNQGKWEATTELAVCSTGAMIWQVSLIIIDGAEQSHTTFFFEAL